MSLSSTVLHAIDRAQSSLGDLVITITLKSTSTVFNNSTGKAEPTEVTKYLKASVDRWESDEVDGDLVRSDDVKLIDFSVSVPIDLSDSVEFNGVSYNLVKITPTYVGNHVGVRTLQLRR
jgi:hypothetical protein